MAIDSKLRDDFEIYKTQVAICGWSGLAVIIVLIIALIYAIFSVRKLRKEFNERVKTLEAERRFTIDRPKVYSSSDPTSKLKGEIGKALSVDSRDSRDRVDRTAQPSPSVQPETGAAPYLNHGYTNLGSPGMASLFSNLNSPSPNTNLRSPSPNSQNKNTNRVESFLDKTRQLYSQSSTDVSPRLPKPTSANGNRDSNVFKFS
ncbi:uncharacterized protein LOC108917191 isoform X1 [Anoplophora glabripennis]|uniref:uncharacterized protein LOC108917191 isoform X2 n=1 Tax=Anoplophora glabripennis TaxID=217634 RepID=UPI000873AA69|nr:uncharacterized protein LOC108917191 isoform X2 [Anoplophora glabripennis]XP_023311429.1 uncharacterized protein LOC108917191 isoform X1 [Anoplophora glabripennis]